jgi:hypothetical protein
MSLGPPALALMAIPIPDPFAKCFTLRGETDTKQIVIFLKECRDALY